MSAQVTLNIDELKSTLTFVIENNKHLVANGLNPITVNVESGAGIGKTSSIMQLADELKMDMHKLSLAEIEEIGDLVGFPIKEYEVRKPESTDTKWVPENLLPTYLNAKWNVTGAKRMEHAPPSWIQGRTKPLMLILDDYSRGDSRFMQATMSITDRQEYVSWKLPEGSIVVLSSNPDDGEYHVTTLDNAQKTRFMTIQLEFNIDCWARYAESINLDTRCINFLLMHPELVTPKVNARSITNFFNSISSIKDFSNQLPLIQMLGEGSVGSEFSTLFSMFINNKLDKLINPHEMLTGKWETVHEKMWGAVGKGDIYRADIGGVLATRMINYSLHYSTKNNVTTAIKDRIKQIITCEEVFTNDLRYYIAKGIVNGDKGAYQSLMMDPAIVAISIK